eukprot:5482362-Ditylum_brightwellii.AAC.1
MGRCTALFFRLLLLDVPLVLLFTTLLSVDILHHVTHTYLQKMYNNLMFSDDDIRRERERTFIPYYCDADTISTSSSRDIILDPAIHTGKDGVETTLKHGVAAYRNVLSEDTATDLRSWVMEKNKNHDITETYWFGVQTGKHRE